MRVVSWNMNKRRGGNWEWVIENFDPDYVLAQEASPLPTGVKATTRTTTKKSNRSAFYSKVVDHEKLKMSTDSGMGLIVTRSDSIFFICVYANLDFSPVDPPLMGLIATFVTNIRRHHDAQNILIAGDSIWIAGWMTIPLAQGLLQREPIQQMIFLMLFWIWVFTTVCESLIRTLCKPIDMQEANFLGNWIICLPRRYCTLD